MLDFAAAGICLHFSKGIWLQQCSGEERSWSNPWGKSKKIPFVPFDPSSPPCSISTMEQLHRNPRHGDDTEVMQVMGMSQRFGKRLEQDGDSRERQMGRAGCASAGLWRGDLSFGWDELRMVKSLRECQIGVPV